MKPRENYNWCDYTTEEKNETKESEEISKEVVEAETPKSTPEQKQAEFASEKVAKYNEFVKKTGKEDYSEFLHWQTPTDELNKEELLRRYYSEQEGMSEKEIAYKLSTMDVSESQDPDDDYAEPLDEQVQQILNHRNILWKNTLD